MAGKSPEPDMVGVRQGTSQTRLGSSCFAVLCGLGGVVDSVMLVPETHTKAAGNAFWEGSKARGATEVMTASERRLKYR